MSSYSTASCLCNAARQQLTSAALSCRTLFTAFGIFLYQLSSVLVVNVRSSKAAKFTITQFCKLYVGIISW